jgi:hypothetical protein
MADSFRRRRARIKEVTWVKKYLFNTPITTYGLNTNENSLAQIDQVFELGRF